MSALDHLSLFAAACLLPTAVLAQPPATQPAAEDQQASLPAEVIGFPPDDAERAPATFLGVIAHPLSPTLAEQLELPPHTGLMINNVVPESPAARAGLQPQDVLVTLNEQVLINTHQLAVLVRTAQPGEQVTLDILRDGTPHTLTAGLVEKHLPPLEQMQVMIPPPGPVRALTPPGAAPSQGMVLRVAGLDDAERVVSSVSAEGKITLRINGQGKHLTVTAPDGTVQFDGPVNTQEELDQLPPAVRARCLQAQKLLTRAQSRKLTPVSGQGDRGSQQVDLQDAD